MGKQKGKRRFASLLILNLLLAAFLLGMMWIRPADPIREYAERRPDWGADAVVYGYHRVSQDWITDQDADTIELWLGNINNAHGSFRVTLRDGEGNVLQTWDMDKLDLGESGWKSFRVANGIKKKTPYTLEISATTLNKESAVRARVTQEEPRKGWVCRVNGQKTIDRLLFSVCTTRTNWFFPIATGILFLTANFWWFNRKKDIRKTAFPILLGMGLIMMLIMAPESQPDEEYHYCSALKFSNIMMGIKENIGEADRNLFGGIYQHENSNETFLKVMNEIGGTPEAEPEEPEEEEPEAETAGTGSLKAEGPAEEKPSEEKPLDEDPEGELPEEELTEEEEEKTVRLERSDSLNYPIGYFVPAIGITAVRLLGGNLIQAYTLARLLNMLLYVGLCAAAIRIMPKKRELFLLICMIPMAMHTAASVSRDVFVNGMVLVFTAYMFRFICREKKFGWNHALAAVGLLALFSPVKIMHGLLGLLVLCIPKEQFKGRGDRIGKTALVILGSLAVLAAIQWQEAAKALTESDYMGKTDYYHLDFLWTSPLRYLKLLVSSVEDGFWYYSKESIGQRLAGLRVPVAEWLIIAYMAVLLAAAFRQEGTEEFLGRKQKILLIAFCVLGYVLMAMGFSFKDTIYGSTEIAGIQGRYLLPFAAPFLYGIGSRRVKIQLEGYRLLYPVWFIEAGFIVYVMSQIYVP